MTLMNIWHFTPIMCNVWQIHSGAKSNGLWTAKFENVSKTSVLKFQDQSKQWYCSSFSLSWRPLQSHSQNWKCNQKGTSLRIQPLHIGRLRSSPREKGLRFERWNSIVMTLWPESSQTNLFNPDLCHGKSNLVWSLFSLILNFTVCWRISGFSRC